jgi:uncharacterized membrane protein YbhN (UPF0104 family)
MENNAAATADKLSWLKKLIPVIFYGLLLLFLALYLKSIDFSKFHEAHFAWSYVVIASVIGLATRYWQIFIWLTLLKGLGAQNLSKSKGQLIYVYAKSWMGRYIPGTAPWILGKIYFASKHGISKHKLAVSSLLEGGLQIAVVMALAFVMLLFDSRLHVIHTDLKVLMAIVLAVCLICIVPPVFNRIVSVAYRLLRHKVLDKEHLASGGTILKGVLLYGIGGLVNGVSFFFIAKAVDPSLSYHSMTFVMATGNLATAASMLAIFAPSGIGVREGIQLVLLSAIMPKELALLVTITTRLWGVALDLVFFGLSRLIAKAGGSPPAPPNLDAPLATQQ